jgi:signal transduction histidine kinase
MNVKKHRKGMQSRLIRVFAVQASIVSLATILGVYAAYVITAKYLVREALIGEAAHFWMRYDKNPQFPLPDTRNLNGFLFNPSKPSREGIPDALKNLSTDFFGRVKIGDNQPIVFVSEHKNAILYLVFKERQVSRLALLFGVAPLSVVLILIYMSSWFTFRQSQRLISPITQLSRIVENADVDAPEQLEDALLPLVGIDADIDALAKALTHYAERIRHFIERERNFTGYASHELRTPLAVLKGSLDIFQYQTELSQSQQKIAARMRSTIEGMESLILTLLMLAREESDAEMFENEEVNISEQLPHWIEQTKTAVGEPLSDTEITLYENGLLKVSGSTKILCIVVINLLRNALQFGQGKAISITIDPQRLVITDQGIGMETDQLNQAFDPFYRSHQDGKGHGLGLALVKKICDRYDWKIIAYSALGKGTSMTIDFSQSVPRKD